MFVLLKSFLHATTHQGSSVDQQMVEEFQLCHSECYHSCVPLWQQYFSPVFQKLMQRTFLGMQLGEMLQAMSLMKTVPEVLSGLSVSMALEAQIPLYATFPSKIQCIPRAEQKDHLLQVDSSSHQEQAEGGNLGVQDSCAVFTLCIHHNS